MSTVVMYAYNDARTDARVLKEAATLAAAGHDVTVVARLPLADPPGIRWEARNGFTIIRVPAPTSWRRRWRIFRYPWLARHEIVGILAEGLRRPGSATVRALGTLGLAVVALPWVAFRAVAHVARRRTSGDRRDDTLDWLAHWRWGILGWGRAAAAVAPRADVHHGHDLTGLAAAVRAAERDGSFLVYDSHELFVDSGSNAARPAWARAILRVVERRWAKRAAALVTVNRSLAERLAERLRIQPTVVVHNCPPRWHPPAEPPDLLRGAAAIPSSAPVALYHGGLVLHRGIEELAEALLEPGMAAVHGVALGYGSLQAQFEELARDPRLGGRFHVLSAVTPDELPWWIASADVGVMPIQRSTLNHYLSTPNKLFECLAAGVPVVASDFPEMRRIVVADPDGPLGALCDPARPSEVACAIRSIVELPARERASLRARCLRAAHDRWNWETESARLLKLYEELTSADLAGREPSG